MTATTDFEVYNGVNIGKTNTGDDVNVIKTLILETPATADATNTLAITMSDYGMTTLLAFNSWAHSTDNSVVVTEQDTSAVADGVLTFTIVAGTDDDKRIIQIFYE